MWSDFQKISVQNKWMSIESVQLKCPPETERRWFECVLRYCSECTALAMAINACVDPLLPIYLPVVIQIFP